MPQVVERLDRVVIRIAGGSGDGMQLTGDRFTQETAMLGNDLATFLNCPAEIRAPQGTLAGVSSFQLHFADHDIFLTDSNLSRTGGPHDDGAFDPLLRVGDTWKVGEAA